MTACSRLYTMHMKGLESSVREALDTTTTTSILKTSRSLPHTRNSLRLISPSYLRTCMGLHILFPMNPWSSFWTSNSDCSVRN